MKVPQKVYGYSLYCQGIQHFSILAYIIDSCNYNCYYCYNHFPRYNEKINLDNLLIFIKYIRKEKPNHKILLDLIGGETTLHPKLFEFCKNAIQISNIEITIYTNFSQDVDYYLNYFKLGINFIVSWHSECNSNKFIEKFKKIDNQYIKNNICLSIMFENRNSELSLEIFDYFKKEYPYLKRLYLSLLDKNLNFMNNEYSKIQSSQFESRLQDNITQNTVIEFNDGSKEIVSDNYFFADQSKKNFRFWKCNAGVDFIYIHFNGDIHPCDEHDKIILANINSNIENINLKFKGLFCNRTNCPCLFDIYKEKVFKK